MKEFMSFYRWGINMKFHMAIYTIALVCMKSVVNLVQGTSTVSIWIMLEMLLASMVLAIAETVLFPEKKELSGAALKARTVVWVLLGNLLFAGGAVAFHWFAGVPVWAAVLLAVILEGGFFAMWVGIHVVLKKDSDQLNKNLRSFQQET